MNRPLTLALCLAVPSVASAQSSGARNQAMGGAGVASSNPQVAAFVNPALMHHRVDDRGVSVTLPFVGAFAADSDELVDAVDDLQDSIEALQARIDANDIAGANALRPVVTQQLQDIDGDSLDAFAAAGLGVVVPLDGFTLGISARTFVDARALTFVDPADIALINGTTTSTDLDNLSSSATVAAAAVTEFGLSASTAVELFGRNLTIGVTPKAQSVETFNYAVSVSDFDDDDALDDFDDDQFRDSESGFNVDVGAALDLNDRAVVALSIQNLISDTYRTVITDGRQFSYRVEPRPVAGISYELGGLMLTGDVELLATSRFEEVDDSQFVRVGAEYDIAGWVQLRGGLAFDLEDTQEDVFSAGLGLAPFETFRVELVGQLADNGYGAGLQLGLTF